MLEIETGPRSPSPAVQMNFGHSLLLGLICGLALGQLYVDKINILGDNKDSSRFKNITIGRADGIETELRVERPRKPGTHVRPRSHVFKITSGNMLIHPERLGERVSVIRGRDKVPAEQPSAHTHGATHTTVRGGDIVLFFRSFERGHFGTCKIMFEAAMCIADGNGDEAVEAMSLIPNRPCGTANVMLFYLQDASPRTIETVDSSQFQLSADHSLLLVSAMLRELFEKAQRKLASDLPDQDPRRASAPEAELAHIYTLEAYEDPVANALSPLPPPRVLQATAPSIIVNSVTSNPLLVPNHGHPGAASPAGLDDDPRLPGSSSRTKPPPGSTRSTTWIDPTRNARRKVAQSLVHPPPLADGRQSGNGHGAVDMPPAGGSHIIEANESPAKHLSQQPFSSPLPPPWRPPSTGSQDN